MLDMFKRYFNTATAETQEELMDQETLVAAEATTELAVKELTANLADVQAKFAELSNKYEAAQAALAASKEAQEMLLTQAATKRLAARTSAITAAVGTDKLATMLAATDSLDDTQFNTIVSAMAASFEAEAKTPMFQEKGVAASALATDTEESAEMKLLKAKFAQSK